MSDSVAKEKICVMGIGNSLRSDDGAGALVCKLLENENIPWLEFIVTQQLDPAMADDLNSFEKVVFVDAAIDTDGVVFRQLEPAADIPSASSHHINAAMLASLAVKIYDSKTNFWLCSIGAHDFEMGENISESTMQNVLEAVTIIAKWAREND